MAYVILFWTFAQIIHLFDHFLVRLILCRIISMIESFCNSIVIQSTIGAVEVGMQCGVVTQPKVQFNRHWLPKLAEVTRHCVHSLRIAI